MKNKLIDLNNYLFEQLERLNDDDLDLETEIRRTKAITDVSKNIIDNANALLNAQKYFNELDFTQSQTPKLFLKDENEKIQSGNSGLHK